MDRLNVSSTQDRRGLDAPAWAPGLLMASEVNRPICRALSCSGFLPSSYQGVPFRSGGDPILDLSRPQGVSLRAQQDTIETLRDINLAALAESGDPEIATRVSA